jgi:pimeloyl-ACP methyl ester carboxylesterase
VEPQPAFVLVHGGYHGAWCWGRLLPLLGDPAIAVDLPGRGSRPAPFDEVTIEVAARSVQNDLDQAGLSSVILVGHSLGGASLPVIAGRLGDRVKWIVFVSAFVVPDGRSAFDALRPEERSAATERLRTGPGQQTTLSREEHRHLLCNDMEEELAQEVLDRVGPDSMHFFTDTVSWAGVSPATRRMYIRLGQDRALPPEAQDQMISRLGADVVVKHIDSGHEVMLTRPEELASVLRPLRTLT